MEDTDFKIQLPLFEGPFDLLLFFIKRDEIPIDEVKISKITDDFLNYIKQMTAMNVELASEFIYMAATLMEIKAKMLLPRPVIDEEGNEVNPEEELLRSLAMYSKFKEVAEKMRELETVRNEWHERGNVAEDVKEIAQFAAPGEELQSFDLYKLMLVYHKIQLKYQQSKQEVRHTVVQYPYSIEMQKKTIQHLVSINEQIDCVYILKNSDNKVHFVYNFLAVLELLQQQELSLHLGEGYNNFWVTLNANRNQIHFN